MVKKDGSRISVSFNGGSRVHTAAFSGLPRSFLPDSMHTGGVGLEHLPRPEDHRAQGSTPSEKMSDPSDQMAIAVMDLDFCVTYCNPVAERFYSVPNEDIFGRNILKMTIHTKDPDERYQRIIEDIKIQGEYQFYLEQDTEDGIRYIDSRITGILSMERKMIGYFLIGQDITKGVKREVDLNCSKLQHESVLDNIDSFIYLADMNSNEIIFMNAPMKKLFGDDAAGRVCWKVLHADQDGPCDQCTNDKLINADGDPNSPIIREMYNEKLGAWYELHVQAIRWWDGHLRRLGIMTDITERKRKEQVLRENEEQLRIVADFTFDWEYWIGPNGNFIYVSPSCERITGYTVEEFVRDPGLLMSIVHPEDRHRIEDHSHVRQNNNEISPIDFRIITRSREIRWISHICQPVHGEEGCYLGRRASNRDITRQKECEEQVIPSNSENEELLRELYHEIDSNRKVVPGLHGQERKDAPISVRSNGRMYRIS